MKRSILLTSVAAIAFLAVVGCSLLSSGIATFSDMTPKQRSLWLMSMYNKEYAEYQAKAAEPDALSEEDRIVMRLKKEAMTKAWPLLKAYNSMINSGVLSESTERAAFEAIEALLGIGGGPNE